jgi:ElaB/YqjD/DUF883 family membrane-anchored ribosome-binding protein
MKVVNPLYYPIAVLAGAIVLVVGVRAKIPSLVVVPVAVVLTLAGSTAIASQQPSPTLDNPALERELQSIRQQARVLAEKANSLRLEAARLLTESTQITLLAGIQYACDRAGELPVKIDELARRMQGVDSLLAVSDLQQQLQEVENKLQASSGTAQEQFNKLSARLRHNIQLAQQGLDARQAQVASLSTLILDAAGVLQAMQNQLRTIDLADSSQTEELQTLSDELRLFQENVDLLVSR